MNINKTIVIGNEYDSDCWRRLKSTIKQLNGTVVNREYHIGGSQELSVYTVSIGNEVITIESETYIGISATGNERIVDMLAKHMRSTA